MTSHHIPAINYITCNLCEQDSRQGETLFSCRTKLKFSRAGPPIEGLPKVKEGQNEMEKDLCDSCGFKVFKWLNELAETTEKLPPYEAENGP